MTPAPPTARASSEKALLIFIAYRRGPEEGSQCAQWLNQQLKGRALMLDAGRTTAIQTYFDQRAPAIHDWTQKWKGDLRTARAMILVCSNGTGTRRSGEDWLYDEIDWWIKTRRTAPIVIVTNQDDTSVIPPAVFSRWPKAQRIVWSSSSDEEEHAAVIERIVEGLIVSERGINYEDLRRLKIRNRGLAILTVIALLLGVILFFFASWEREQKRLAERNLQLSYGPNLQVALKSYEQGEITEAKKILTALSPELRGYEWNLLRNLVDQSRQTWTEKTDVNDLDFSPDGNFLALAQSDGTVIVRAMKDILDKDRIFNADLAREEQRVTLPGTEAQLAITNKPNVSRAIFFAPTSFATTGTDGLIHVWDVSGTSETLLPTVAPTTRTLAMSRDREWLASATADGTIQVWEINPIRQHEAHVTENPAATFKVDWEQKTLPAVLAFSPDNQFLVVVGLSSHPQTDYSPYVQLWDWKAQRRIGFLESKAQVTSVCTLGQAVYGARDDGSIVTWDLQTWKAHVLLEADRQRAPLELIRAAPNERFLAAVAQKRKIILFDLSNSKARTLGHAEADITALQFDPEEDRLLSASRRKIKFYDLRRSPPRVDLPDLAKDALDVSSDGNVLVSSNEWPASGYFHIWNLSNKTSINIPAPLGVRSVSLFPDKSRFVAGWSDGTVQCYRVADGGVVWKSKASDKVDSLTISPDSRLVITGTEIQKSNPVLEIWDAQSGERRKTLPGAGHLSLTQDGKLLATAGGNYLHFNDEELPLFRIYRMDDFREVILGPPRRDPPQALVFDPQGTRLLVIGNEIEIWKLSSPPEMLQHISLQDKTAASAAFSPDGSRLVVSVDGALTIWNADTGDLLLRFDDGNYRMVRWIGQKLYVQNFDRVTVFDGSIDGLEDWEATERLQAEIESLNKPKSARASP